MYVARTAREIHVIEVSAKSVLNRVRGMPFGWSINPYGGCVHQCVFCYARKVHGYRDEDGVADWGARVFAKTNAPRLLRAELRGLPRGARVALGTATDPYQAPEARYRITRAVLGELVRARVATGIVTRSPLVLRDLDLLTRLADVAPLHVYVSLPTLDAALAREIEPTVAPPAKRLLAVRRLAAAGIRVGVIVAPILPHLTDDAETFAAVAREAGAAGASDVRPSVLHLGEVARDAFFAYLADRRPQLRATYERMYPASDRRGNAPASYARAVADRYARATAPHSPAPRRDRPPAPPREPSLFDEP